jgi:hypothetical protein
VGGRFSPPFFIDNADEMELPSGFVVGQESTGPDEAEGIVARALGAAMRQAAWLSVWEVLEVEPGVGLTLHADPLSSRRPSRPAAVPPGPPPPEALEAMRQLERRHYAAWLDESIPALGGESPRAAVRTARGREAVDLLLKEFENHEQRVPGGKPFDFAPLRRELGLKDR